MAQGLTAQTAVGQAGQNCNILPQVAIGCLAPRVVLHCIFMASSCNKPTVATPAVAGTANLKTRIRRLQRKHTEASYRHMKEKLLQIVQPLPKAVYAADLEEFRHTLYCKEEPVLTNPLEPCINRCMWCGIWTPLPTQPIIATTRQPLLQQLEAVDTSVDALLEECLCQAPFELETLEETTAPIPKELQLDNQEQTIFWTNEPCMYRTDSNSVKNNEIHLPSLLLPPVTPEVSYILDMFEYLTGGPMLCEVVSLMRGRDISLDKDLRGQRAAALQARSVEQCQSLTWLSSQPEPTPDQHGTDPNTGECSQQYSTAMQTKMKRYILRDSLSLRNVPSLRYPNTSTFTCWLVVGRGRRSE